MKFACEPDCGDLVTGYVQDIVVSDGNVYAFGIEQYQGRESGFNDTSLLWNGVEIVEWIEEERVNDGFWPLGHRSEGGGSEVKQFTIYKNKP